LFRAGSRFLKPEGGYLPNALNGHVGQIIVQHFINGNGHHLFYGALSEEDSVKWVAVVQWQGLILKDVGHFYGQDLDAILSDVVGEFVQWSTDTQSPNPDFDGHFPKGGQAHKWLVVRVFNRLAGSLAQFGRAFVEPNERVRIQEQSHQM
jgi:hypothetical protein